MKALKGTAGLAMCVQNQLIPGLMAARLKAKSLAEGLGNDDKSVEVPGMALNVAVLTVTAASIALIASEAPAQVLQGLLAVLAAAGLFFLLAASLGRLNFAAKPQAASSETIAASWPDPVLITTRLGSTVFANEAFERLFPHAAGSGFAALEEACQRQPAASEALFRLVRLAERGETAREDIGVRLAAAAGTAAGTVAGEVPEKSASAQATRISVAALSLDQLKRGPLVLWRFEDMSDDKAWQNQQVNELNSRLSAYESSPIGLLMVGHDGRVASTNATLASWLGLPGAADDAGLETIFSPPGGEILRRNLARSSATGFDCHLELASRNGRGGSVHVMTAPAPVVPGTNGQPEYRSLVVVREPSMAAGAALPGSSDLSFARHFQAAPFGIATVSTAGRIVSANGAFAHMALDASAGIDAPAFEVLARDATPEVRATVQRHIADALSGGASLAPVDFTIGLKGEFGRRMYVTPLPASATGGEAAILYVIDTTEQKALEAKFTQSQKMEAVGKLAGGIAHDFNNVLTAIIGSADLMLQTHRASDAAHKDIQNIKQCANRAAGLVGKLMAFSRQQPMQLEALLLGEMVVDARQVLKTSLGEKIDFKVQTGRDLWYVKADRTQIDQVLLNLAVNAADAMPGGGTFTIRARNITEREAQKAPHPGLPVAEFVLIEVEDTGTGMPPEVLAKIFEPFFTTKDIGKGTGLGLATVYGIVKQSSGFIYTESVQGKGTTFRIYLPRFHVDNEAELIAQKAARKETKPADLTGSATVLIVEDEDMVRSVAVRSLKRLGYNVLEAGNGLEALDIVASQNGKVDIVVSDVVMPEMDGPAFLKQVRKTNPSLKIIFVSGHTNEAFKTSLDENETFAFLPKPFSLPQLAAKVKEELGP